MASDVISSISRRRSIALFEELGFEATGPLHRLDPKVLKNQQASHRAALPHTRQWRKGERVDPESTTNERTGQLGNDR